MADVEKLYAKFEVDLFKRFDAPWMKKCEKTKLAEIAKNMAAVFEKDGSADYEENYNYLKQDILVKEVMIRNNLSRDEAIELMKSAVEG